MSLPLNMGQRYKSDGLRFVAAALSLLIAAHPVRAQAPEDVRIAFLEWAEKSLQPVSNADLDASTKDLRHIERMIGDAKIVGLSEGIHGAAEPLIFRNRLLKHLVEHLGFNAIAIESGVVESRVLNDYVTQGKGDFDTVLKQGFSNGFDTFRQNGELLRWMKEYNARLPPDAAKVQIFGLDVPGSPGNFDAARGPDTALRSALEYLRVADPQAAMELQSRIEAFLPVLKGINGYGELKQSERDALTAAIADLVSLMERQRLAYLGKSSKDDFDWAERAAIGARQTDTWFRRMPLEWKLEDGLEWTRYAMQVRDRTMADNLEWVRSRLGSRGRVLVFAAAGHLATTAVQVPASPFRETVPLGAYIKDRYGSDFINILNLVANGEIEYCSANPRRLMPLKPPPGSAVETLFAAVNVPRYVLDLRRASPDVSSWLQQVHDHWNGFGAVQFATAGAFDLVYYVSPVTSACVPRRTSFGPLGNRHTTVQPSDFAYTKA
ncbi:MAG TPA: erythromycin esterase family protein [Steroidobacteraceae bacterium]|nr:erythromycin esterase family protein [Steroidobacteraceae bacterium]